MFIRYLLLVRINKPFIKAIHCHACHTGIDIDRFHVFKGGKYMACTGSPYKGIYIR